MLEYSSTHFPASPVDLLLCMILHINRLPSCLAYAWQFTLGSARSVARCCTAIARRWRIMGEITRHKLQFSLVCNLNF